MKTYSPQKCMRSSCFFNSMNCTVVKSVLIACFLFTEYTESCKVADSLKKAFDDPVSVKLGMRFTDPSICPK